MTIIGFCGADNQTDIADMIRQHTQYPTIEWGILFHPDKVNTSRYPGEQWLSKLKDRKLKDSTLRLAGHLCGTYCSDVIKGNIEFIRTLSHFDRFQVNATKENGVTFDLPSAIAGLSSTITSCPNKEWILQYNDQTKELCQGVKHFPNVSLLYDSSCGTGQIIDRFENVENHWKVGFAGGISDSNIRDILNRAILVKECEWIDMESGVRENDMFSIEKCERCMKNIL